MKTGVGVSGWPGDFRLGTLLLAIYFAIEMTASRPVFVEVVSIAGCFSIWEAVDTWLLERKKLKVDYLCAVQAVLCEVVFIVSGADHGMSYFMDKEGYEMMVKDFWRQFD